MNTPNKFDLYIENQLSESEKKDFERELKQQPDLADSFLKYSHINKVLKNELFSPILSYDDDPILKDLSISQRIEIEEDFNRFHEKGKIIDQEHQAYSDFRTKNDDIGVGSRETEFIEILKNTKYRESKSFLRNPWPYIGIAAAILVAFFSIKLIFESNSSLINKLSPQEVYALYYNPKADNELKKFKINGQRLDQAIIDYKRNRQTSDPLFLNKQQVYNDDYALSLFFLGIINMERNNFEEARQCFSRILKFEDPVKAYSVNYYLALSCLNAGNIDDSYSLLLNLAENKNPYRKKARAILRSLKHN